MKTIYCFPPGQLIIFKIISVLWALKLLRGVSNDTVFMKDRVAASINAKCFLCAPDKLPVIA